MPDSGTGRPPGPVLLRGRSGAVIIFGFLAALFSVALVASEGGQSSAGGRISAGVFFGIFLAGSVAALVTAWRSRAQIEVGRDAIVSRGVGRGTPVTLTAAPGDTLRILPQFKLYARVYPARLIFLGRGGYITLTGFSPDRVRQTCQEQGWRFDGDPALAVRDVQSWLHRGRSAEAVQLLQLFGPFPDAAADGEPHTALAAAVFEDAGDKLARGARASARDAYQRAADAQRAFVGVAQTRDEQAARLAEAARIDGKAQG
jgi:hypothetical protein